jgi:monoterpene epsilon-lactone hydrolase
MKSTFSRLAFLLISISISSLTGFTFAGECLVIAEREIPVPAAASLELQKSIREFPSADITARLDYPSSTKEWIQLQSQRNEVRAARVPALALASEVQITRKKIEDINVTELAPAVVKDSNKNRLFIHLHGGAYVVGKGDAGLAEGIVIANRLNISVLSIDYRMPPENPFPTAVEDVVTVYRALLKNHAPESLVIGGTSAGGGLAFAAVHKLRELGLQTPAAVYGGTPWVDLSKTGDTFFTNEGLDRILVTYDGILSASAKLYAGEHDLKNPLISPVYGDFQEFPPAFLVTGTRDLLLSDIARIHRKLTSNDIDADLHVYEGMSHADYLVVADSPESLEMFSALDKFVEKHLK